VSRGADLLTSGPAQGLPGPILRLERVSKTFGEIVALADVSLAIHPGEVHGLCGHNGAGKTTLMRILTGLESADAGQIRTGDGELLRFRSAQDAQRAGIAIVDQESSLVSALTVTENIFLGNIDQPLILRGRERKRQALALLQLVGIGDLDPRERLGSLDLGTRKLVDIAHVLGRQPKLIILDEPTAALSHREGRRVFDAIRSVTAHGTAVVFVSHRLDEVLELCARVTVLRDGRGVATVPGNELDKDILVELMLGKSDRAADEARSATTKAGPAVRVSGLTVPPLVNDFALEVPSGATVGLAGQVGSGASEVLQGIAGLQRRVTGTLEVGQRRLALGWPASAARAGVRYVPPDRKTEGLFLGQTIETNLTATRLRPPLSRFGVVFAAARARAARHLMELVGVRAKSIRVRAGKLSGGNQQKVLIGRNLEASSQELLLLDDPTRGVDVHGRAEIHRLIREVAEDTAVIFVSTEIDELMDLADIVVTMFRGDVVTVRRVEDTSASVILAEMTHSASARSQ
jgi:ABC-type sugar transport system ATPase subunit